VSVYEYFSRKFKFYCGASNNLKFVLNYKKLIYINCYDNKQGFEGKGRPSPCLTTNYQKIGKGRPSPCLTTNYQKIGKGRPSPCLATKYKNIARSGNEYMKTIEVAQSNLTIIELLELAEKDTLILQKSDGTEFILSLVDDFSAEVEALGNNQEFMDFLAKRSQSVKRVSLEEARKRLKLDE